MDNYASRIISIFGNDIKHLHGNLFRVKKEKIRLAKNGVELNENGEIIYGNPRWFKSNGEYVAHGINVEKNKLEELKNSIQNEGLENPIRLRVVEGKNNFLEVINGERRFRSIQDLCEHNLKCFDCVSNQQKNANEIFEWIDARINFMDDKTALRVALKPNETSEKIGDLANLNIIKLLRKSGYDDQDILKATGKSISWLRDSEKIISLDEISFNHFCEEKINRKIAIHLSQIENLDERLSLLEKITASAATRHAEKKKEINNKKEKASRKLEIEQARTELAEKYGDDEEVQIHKEKSKKVSNKIKKLEKESEEIDKEEPTATSKDLEKVVAPKPLTHNKIQSIYISTISAIIDNEGYDDDGDYYGFDMSILQGIMYVLQAIMSGDKDIMQILSDSCITTTEEEELDSNDNEEKEEEYSVEAEDGDEDEDEDEEEEEYGDEDYDYDDVNDEEEMPIELEKEFEEAAYIDEEDLD